MTEIGDQRIDAFLDALASKSPTPGGGAVAGLVGAVATALGEMVLAYSVGRASLAEHDELHERAGRTLTTLRARALELSAADARAYGALNALWRLPEDDPIRQRDFPDAVRAAIAAPRAAVECCVEVLDCLTSLRGATNRMLDSDFVIAADLAHAAARAAAWNVRVNVPSLEDEDERTREITQLDAHLQRAAELARTFTA